MTTAPPMADEELDHVRLINTHPDQDNPRLEYADWLDEHGQPDRAELIRVQCELARWTDPKRCPTCGRERRFGWREDGEEWTDCPNDHKWKPGDHSVLRRRERELRDSAINPGGFMDQWGVASGLTLDHDSFCRGFVVEVTCTAADWLAVERALYWRPVPCRICNGHRRPHGPDDDPTGCPGCSGTGRAGPTDECPERVRYGEEAHDSYPPNKCKTCSGSNRVPRPCPPTVQPLERVRLTGCRIHDSVNLPAGFGAGRVRPHPLPRAYDEVEFEFTRWPGLGFVFV